MSSSDLEQTLNAARRKILAGEQIPTEEQAELVKQLRANRFAAAEAGTASRSKKAASKATISDDALNDALGDLGL